jgi:1,4-alpha-glucan branching enzyme
VTGLRRMPEGERSKRVVNELQVVTSANQAVVKVRDEDIESVGTFNDWDGGKHPMQAEENGHWYTDVAEAYIGDQYRCLLTTAKSELKRIDPYAREATSSVGNAWSTTGASTGLRYYLKSERREEK